MASLGKHNSLAKLDIEAERLAWPGSHQISTATTRKNVIGAYDRDPLRPSRQSVRLDAHPVPTEIYDDRFLPPRDERIPLN